MSSIYLQGYNIELPNEPPHEDIDYYGLPLTEQYWRPTYNYTDEQFYELPVEDRQRIIDVETERRVFGYWFFNKGRPFYLTGDNYFFLNYWTIDGKKPQFIINQSKEFYFDEMVDKDPKCYGSIKLKPRREGCTQRTISRYVNKATLVRNKLFGIQSKTGEDASGVNFRNLIQGFDKIPDFMKPKISGSYPPAEALKFGKPTIRMTKSNQKEANRNSSAYLNTIIDWANTVAESYDGKKLFRYIGDEYSKATGMDIELAWQIVKQCLVDGFDIIGKAYILSTISEVSVESAMKFVAMWDRSDFSVKNKLGQTESGLYRWFIPAWATKRGSDPVSGELIINKFGETNETLAKRALNFELEGIKNKRDRYIWIKQHPFTVEDAIKFGMDTATFDNERLGERYRELEIFIPTETRKEIYEIGNLHWRTERFGEVFFEKTDEGKWFIPYFPMVAGAEATNRIKVSQSGIVAPFSDTQFCMGVDHYDYKETMSEGSEGAFHVKLCRNPNNKDLQFIYCAEYLYRENDPLIFYEDVIKTAIFYGAKVLPEQSQQGIFDYFRQNKLTNFLIRRPDITKGSDYTNSDNRHGVPASPQNIVTGLGLIQSYIALPDAEYNENVRDNLKTFWLDRTIEQAMKYTYKDKTKYDLIASWGLTEIAAQSLKKEVKLGKTDNNLKLLDYITNRKEYKAA